MSRSALTLNTILSTPTESESFWESVIRFLIRNQPIALDESLAIVSFIHSQRFRPANVLWGLGERDIGKGLEPLQLDEVVWTVEELLTREDLFAEGGIMQHCVVRYANACRRQH